MRYSNKLVNSKLSLTFANITDAQAESILAHYIDVNSDWDYVIFTTARALRGMATDMQRRINGQPGGLRWRYMKPPQVTSVQPGISTVQCEFCAYLDG